MDTQTSSLCFSPQRIPDALAMAQCCLKNLSAAAWGGTVGELPSPKPRALLSRGWEGQRCSKDESNHLSAVCYRPSDGAAGNVQARGISQFSSQFIIMNMKRFKVVLWGDICASNIENSVLPTVNWCNKSSSNEQWENLWVESLKMPLKWEYTSATRFSWMEVFLFRVQVWLGRDVDQMPFLIRHSSF